MDISYFNPREHITKHTYRLPHWQQTGAMYFITWHMADSIPQAARHKMLTASKIWMMNHPKPWDDKTFRKYHSKFTLPYERYLDQGEGSCVLRDPTCSKALCDVLLHFQHLRYDIDSFVVMPNHVHTMVQLKGDFTIQQLMRTWKGISSRKIGQIMNHPPPLWQEGYWDRMVRDHSHYLRCRNYIRNNPTKAGLQANEFVYFDNLERGQSCPSGTAK